MALPPVTVTIADPEVLAGLRAATRGKDQEAARTILTALAEQGLRARLGLPIDLRPRQAAAWLGCSLSTVKNYMRDRLFPNLYYRSSRVALIPLSDLEAFKRN